ncbi:synaptotagmin-like protein 2 isoform X2 [Cololabis saira]|uniref:synaptotagmin-like protein 2 isoform X2 n=1 Tax=Cololabis saira TaxID=129043 RepID=UPI002AD3CAB4|nr:synaptotagmin-like protein 2 isoform X2 [Cololabis saira]
MIDLSFLTEEEQETILVVLRRDAELKNAEEQRVQNLQRTVDDRRQLRFLTGEWFYETKQLRHQNRIQGSDIIRASMKHVQKLLTKLELSYILPERSRFGSSENMFDPPELCGLLPEVKAHINDDGYQSHSHDFDETVLRSPMKRRNPFSSELAFEENNTHLVDGKLEQTHVQNDDVSEQSRSEPIIPGWSSSVCPVTEARKPVQTETDDDDDEGYSLVKTTDQSLRHNTDSPEASSNIKASPSGTSKSSSQASSPKYGQKLQEFLRREDKKTAQIQSPTKKEFTISKQKDYMPRKYISAPEGTVDIPTHVQRDKTDGSTPITDVESMQIKELQKTQFKEKSTLLNEGSLRNRAVSQTSQFSERISARQDIKRETVAKTEIKSFDVRLTNSVSAQMETEDTAGISQENNFLQQADCNMQTDILKDESTYQAIPVFIDEETDYSSVGSMTDSQLIESKQNITSPVQEKRIPVPLPTKSSFPLQEGRPAKIIELKEEFTAPNDQGVFCQSDLKMSSSKSEGGHTWENTAKPKVLKSEEVSENDCVSPDRSHLESFATSVDVQSPCQQYIKVSIVNPNKSQLSRSENKSDKVRKSPSKTYHPKFLPRESSSPTGSSVEGSPLKTFPINININPITEVTEEQQWKTIAVPGQKKSLLQAATTVMDNNPSQDIISHLPPPPDDTSFAHVCIPRSLNPLASTQSRPASGKELARSIILQNQHLGPQDKAHHSNFLQDEETAAEGDAVRANQRDESDTLGIWSKKVPNKGRDSSHEGTARTWSLSLRNSESCGDRPCPITPNLKPSSSRSLPSSKSLETLTSQTTSTHPKPRSMKASCSVPVLQQDKIDGASSFNINMKQDTGSSKSNMSLSSGMTCTSSLSSISSISLADWGDVGVQGSIQFAVNYIQKLVEFQIFVVLCRGLAVADTKNNRSDPYVKCYLLPDKTKLGKRKTSAKKKTLNPTFNEVLTYKIVLELLKTQSLNISVWHNNTFGRNSFLGEVDLDLSEWDFSNTQINEYALKARVSAEISTSTLSSLEKRGGQMRVALRFLLQMPRSKQRARTETGEVQIWVKDCKNLPPVRGGIISPFVKCAVLPDTSWKSRQKTRVVKRTESPMFNHTMVYDGFRLEDLREACVELTVWDHERLKNHYVGGLRLGLGTGKSYGINVVWMDSTTQEVNLWQRMLQFSGEWVEDVLPLRMLESARSMSS